MKLKKYLLFSLYVVFLVLLFEGTARLAFLVPQVANRLRAGDEMTWRREWISRRQDTAKEIYYKFDMYDATKGWRSKPNLRDMKVFEDRVLNTNSKGLRGKIEYSYEKDPNKVRILILGDSFTFGDEVSDNETYSHRLQEMMPHAEVINMGVHGYGHDQMLILLKEEGQKYKPDIIVLGFLTMDMFRNLLIFRDYAKPKFLLNNRQLRLTGSPVPTPAETIKWDWVRPRIRDLFSIASYRVKKLSGLYSIEKQEITTAILAEIIAVADSIHAIPIFTYLPFGNEISVSPALTQGESYFFGMCQTNDNVRCFSTRQRFAEKMLNGITFKTRGHWGPPGHLAVAEAIKQYLVDEGYVAMQNSSDTLLGI